MLNPRKISLREIEYVRNWSLIGIPDDLGVLNVGGRVGAADGPRAFREQWVKLSGAGHLRQQCNDHGDIRGFRGTIEEHHQQTIDALQTKLSIQETSVIIGGGHDHGYTQLAALKNLLDQKHSKKSRLGCINIDAHLDVRKPNPQISSGSPFYLALENKVIHPKSFIEFGIQAQSNGPALWEYVESKKIKIHHYSSFRDGKASQVFQKELKALSKKVDAIVISLDLDAVASAFAPGVSAPQSEGFFPQDIFEMMQISAEQKKVVSLGVFELNPFHDEDHRTAKLAANAVYHFIANRL